MSTFTEKRGRLEEHRRDGMRLGRHIHHDERSRAFRVAAAGVPVSQHWIRRTPTLDQGNVGSCTGNATVGVLGTDPFYGVLTAKYPTLQLDEVLALAIYANATALDGFPGTYPPDDTGSDGLSAAKAAQKAGYVSGYTHALSFDDVLAGLQSGPGMAGISWYDSFDTPSSEGLVSLPAGATVRGGHEVEIDEVDIPNRLLWFEQSWGPTWGFGGRFCMSFATFQRLLAEDGDVTFPTLPTAPAPTPIPPADVHRTFTAEHAAALEAWAERPHMWAMATRAAKAWKA